ncbi:hypothetical protein B0682_03275 [Moraxella lincolnii]|uniref:Factor H binding protein-like C-terminal domain-containing protein n=1 Tax=Lwoffella lincolnii TaxID=90241 RepID=A0A1T0CHA9_9GAMM|nr:factor H binding protein domain-containing protein [Moraxella lincolnii]OOS21683.1 hypothetical protein B0682_03275 [Moraxella lincolnii]
MKVKQITLGSSTLVLAALLTACGGSSSSGVQKPTPLVANTNNSGNHGTTNHGNHGATNPAPKWDATVRYASLRNNAIKEAIDYVKNDAGVIPKIDGYALTIDGRTQNGDIDLGGNRKGHHKFSVQERVTGSADGVQGSITRNSDVYLFKQDYSLIAGIHNKNMTVKLGNETEVNFIGYIDYLVRGVPTEKLPTTGKFNYSGSGKIRSQFGAQDAKFSYDVDFANKTGSGSLGNITLSKGNITTQTLTSEIDNSPITTPTIEGKATDGSLNGDYGLAFFGPNADEIVGSVELGNDKEHVIGMFGGTKQAK